MRPRFLPTALAVLTVAACDRQPTAPTVPTALTTPAPLGEVMTATGYLFDTGTPDNTFGSGLFATGSSPTCSPQPSCLASYQFLGGRFLVAADATVTWVEGWMNVNTSGSLAVSIRADASGLPGAVLESHTFTPGVQPTLTWITFLGFSTPLTAGSHYWVTFEPVASGGFDGAMYGHAPSPLAVYGVNNEVRGGWGLFPSTFNPGYGIRVAGEVTSTPTAAEQIAALRTTLASLTLSKGTYTSLDTKLQAAAKAVDAGDAAAACAALADFVQQALDLPDKHLSDATKPSLVSDANAARSSLGC